MLTKEDKVWLCELALTMTNALVYALADTPQIQRWRDTGLKDLKTAFREDMVPKE